MSTAGEATTEVKLTVTKERIADLLIGFFENSNLWGWRITGYAHPDIPEEDFKIHDQKYSDYPLTENGAVIIAVPGEKERAIRGPHRLDWARIRLGLSTFAATAPTHFGDWLSEQDDAITADVFMQCCLFGKEVFS